MRVCGCPLKRMRFAKGRRLVLCQSGLPMTQFVSGTLTRRKRIRSVGVSPKRATRGLGASPKHLWLGQSCPSCSVSVRADGGTDTRSVLRLHGLEARATISDLDKPYSSPHARIPLRRAEGEAWGIIRVQAMPAKGGIDDETLLGELDRAAVCKQRTGAVRNQRF
ncbi:MAG: hypothetical protein NZ874_00365 [Fimbriimonadales bacterium]|nr:hypothetical protein [Fimbriimonadales bacterium]